MVTERKSPGVYREEIFVRPAPRLVTAVPGFVGFADPASPAPVNQPVLLHRKEEFDASFIRIAGASGFLADAVAAFFDNGGQQCYVVRAENVDDFSRDSALIAAIAALAPLDDMDLLAAPDAMMLALQGDAFVAALQRVQQAMLAQCSALGTRMAILDAPPLAGTSDLLRYRAQLTVGQDEPVNGAIYHPWIRIAQGQGTGSVPPCGHVAGVYARSDAQAGVFKAPANEEVLGALDLTVIRDGKEVSIDIDNTVQDELNPEGVNCLRAFPGRGIRVWGARTLSRDPDWRYVNVRRLFLTLRRWIDQNMTWATLEPNEPRLWVRIQRELTSYLSGLWRAGALAGVTPGEAFYVKCDLETNPDDRRAAGEVTTEIGLAPSVPAEFIVVRVIHRAS